MPQVARSGADQRRSGQICPDPCGSIDELPTLGGHASSDDQCHPSGKERSGPDAAGLPLVPIIVVAVLAGFLAGMFGVGGGILIVPGLVLATG